MPDLRIMQQQARNTTILQSALMTSAEQTLKDRQIKEQAYPVYFMTRDMIIDKVLSGNNNSTLTAWLWPIMRQYYQQNKIPSAHQLPVNFAYYGMPEYAMLAVHNKRYNKKQAKLVQIIQELNELAKRAPSPALCEIVIQKMDKLVEAMEALMKESKDYRMATHLHAGMKMVLTPTTEMHQKIEAVCTQTVQQDQTLMEAFKANNWETIPRLETMQRKEELLASRKAAARNQKNVLPRLGRGRGRGRGRPQSLKPEQCKYEETAQGCFRYNRNGQGTGERQCPYMHIYARMPRRPRPQSSNQPQGPQRPQNPAQRNAGQ